MLKGLVFRVSGKPNTPYVSTRLHCYQDILYDSWYISMVKEDSAPWVLTWGLGLLGLRGSGLKRFRGTHVSRLCQTAASLVAICV